MKRNNMNAKRIWLITVGENLPVGQNRKLRTALLSEELKKRGHKVLWWISAFNHFKKEWLFEHDQSVMLENGVRLFALKGCSYRQNISVARYLDHYLLARKFRKFARKETPPNVIVCSYPPYELAYAAVIFAKQRSIPIIIDIRDQWPDLYLCYVPPYIKPVVRLMLSRDFILNCAVMRSADALTSMMEPLLAWGINSAGRPRRDSDRVFYLGSSRLKKSTTSEVIESLNDWIDDRFVVVFVGTFGETWNPTVLVDSARRLENENIAFVLAGDGPYFKHIQKKSKGLSNLMLTGWVEQNAITALLNKAHLGVITTTREFIGFPNKAFLYMSGGLPILSSCRGDLENILKIRKIGAFYEHGDVTGLNRLILSYASNESTYRKAVENVKTLFETYFDSEKIYADFADYIESFAT